MKNRIVHKFISENIDWHLLAHPCGQLLLVDNDYSGACRWEVAVIMDIPERGGLHVCKYGKHDVKFPLPKAPAEEIERALDEFGISDNRFVRSSLESRSLPGSPAARGFLTWCSLHKRMANDFVAFYEYLSGQGVSPFELPEYKGF